MRCLKLVLIFRNICTGVRVVNNGLRIFLVNGNFITFYSHHINQENLTFYRL